MISVELIDYMGDDLSVVNAARVSYGAESNSMTERDKNLIKFLANNNHSTPFRHTCITLRCKAPIFLARQLGKHQVGFSWNEVSRRYKDGEAINIEMYAPAKFLKRSEKPMDGVFDFLDQEVSSTLREEFLHSYKESLKSYHKLIKIGIAPEQARAVLPQGMVTEWIWTGSLYGFYHMWKQRNDIHAQYEARLFAHRISKIMYEQFPICWGALTKE